MFPRKWTKIGRRDQTLAFAEILAGLDDPRGRAPDSARSDATRLDAAKGRRDPDDTGLEPEIMSGQKQRSSRLSSLFSGNLSWRWPRHASATRAAAAYAEEAATAAETPPIKEPPEAEHSEPPSEDEAIANELGLSASLAIVELQRIRRDFAMKNHPDLFAPALRKVAARRMSIANMLIDEHLKRRRSSQ